MRFNDIHIPDHSFCVRSNGESALPLAESDGKTEIIAALCAAAAC
jgi:hypothetical protein